MPISNSTEERVGVEVSGPTSNIEEQVAYSVAAVGVSLVVIGWVSHQPALIIAGLALVLAGIVLLWRARRTARRPSSTVSLQPRNEQLFEFPRVLEPKEKLDDPGGFQNLSVTFYEVDASNTLGEQIATIDFSSDTYTVIHHQNGDDSKEIEAQKIIPNPVWIDLSKSLMNAYQVNVTPEG